MFPLRMCLNTWSPGGGPVCVGCGMLTACWKKCLTGACSLYSTLLLHHSLLCIREEDMTPQLPAQASCCHASSAIMDTPSGIPSQNNSFTSSFESRCFTEAAKCKQHRPISPGDAFVSGAGLYKLCSLRFLQNTACLRVVRWDTVTKNTHSSIFQGIVRNYEFTTIFPRNIYLFITPSGLRTGSKHWEI